MKYGNYIVTLACPYVSKAFGIYTTGDEPVYGVFQLTKYHNGIGIEETVEKSYKVDLIPALSSKSLFPERSRYVCDLNYTNIKEFDCVNEVYKARVFCKVQNERLFMMREIKKNPDKHIHFKDTKGVIHQFFYNKDNDKYYEVANGEKAVDEDGMFYISEWEMRKILFNIDWEYPEPMKVKYNSFWKMIKNKLKF